MLCRIRSLLQQQGRRHADDKVLSSGSGPAQHQVRACMPLPSCMQQTAALDTMSASNRFSCSLSSTLASPGARQHGLMYATTTAALAAASSQWSVCLPNAACREADPGRPKLRLIVRRISASALDQARQTCYQQANCMPSALGLPHLGPCSSPHSQPALNQVWEPVACRVNAVCPGPILTEGTQRHADSQGVSLEAACQDMIGRMVMPRWVKHTATASY